jgi:phosphoribosyl-AMP cyclohydrolase
MKLMDELTFNDQGLIPVIITNIADGRPLTLCYMNREALAKTIETGKVHVFRRSKGRLMLKGETSGHIQEVKGIFPDCEGRSLMIAVQQHVAGCHAGYMSCYFRQYDAKSDDFRIVEKQVFDPQKVY